MIAYFSFGQSRTVTPPAGWSPVGDGDYPVGTYYQESLFYREMQPGDTGPWSFDTPNSYEAIGVIIAYSGVNTTAPIGSVAASTSTTQSKNAVAPAITIQTAGNVALVFAGNDSGDTWTSPTGSPTYYERFDQRTGTDTGNTSASIYEATYTSSGTTGPKTAVSSTSDYYKAIHVELRGPAADTTPPVISEVAADSITSIGASISWTTDEASDSRVDYGLTADYGSSTLRDATLTVSHKQVITGLASGTFYHYRVRSRDASGNLARSADFTFQTAPPVPLIIDTDIFSDVDDVGALATAFGLQLRGEAQVIAIGVNTRTNRPAVATNSWKCAAAVAQFYNSGDIPIGTDMPNDGTDTISNDFIGPCSTLASASTPTPDTAVGVIRQALVGQADGSVVVVEIGYSENLSALLNSSGDSISPLDGRDLVDQKVKMLVIMAGGYPSWPAENNLLGNPGAAQDVAANWPTKIVWSGYEVGEAVHTGKTISDVHPTTSPVRVSYEAFVGPDKWTYSYDLATVYHAVRPGDPLLTEVGPGTNHIDSDGGNSFTLGSGNQYYLTLSDATSLDASIEALLDTLPPPH